MKYLFIFMLAFMPMNSPPAVITDLDNDKIGEVVLQIKGEGWHKLELFNPQKFDTLHIHIKVDCENRNPYQIRRVAN